MIYFDNAATTKPYEEVANAVDYFNRVFYANPGSPHSEGRIVKEKIDSARKQVAEMLSCDPEHIIFTSSGSEANTMAIKGVEDHLRSVGKTHIVTTEYEHKSILNSFDYMKKHGFDVSIIPVTKDGCVDFDTLKNSIRDDTGFVSVMYVNNEIGTENKVRGFYSFLKNKGIIFHTDCVQAALTHNIIAPEFADMITVSGHKIHATKGVGCLYVNDISILSPVVHGGDQEYGLRGGTENVPAIIGLGVAAEINKNNKDDISKKISVLADVMASLLIDEFGEDSVFHKDGSKIVSLKLNNIDSESAVLLFESDGLMVSPGAACNSVEVRPSHVLKAIGYSDEEASNSIRISFSELNTMKDVLDAFEIIKHRTENMKSF